MRMERLGSQSGITLVDLLVTLLVAGIVLVWGVPSFMGLIATSRMANAANGLVAHLQYARLEAVGRKTRVTVCPSTGGVGCDTADNPQDWGGGYIVAVVDASSPPVVQQVLRRVERGELNGLDASSGGRSRFVFQSDGTASGSPGAIVLTDPNDSRRARSVVVNDVGRAYVR